MNPSEKNDSEALRSDINVTRGRMDDTMGALGDRLKPRHLLDEFVGYLRGGRAEGGSQLHDFGEKLSRSANSAVQAVADTVKRNPMPALLIGAGIAWMLYQGRRNQAEDYEEEYPSRRRMDRDFRSDQNREYSQPVGDSPNVGSEGEIGNAGGLGNIAEETASAPGRVGEQFGHVREVLSAKAGAVAEQVGEKFAGVKEHAGRITASIRDGTREAYARTRQQVATTVDRHPLEVGLAALAAGVIAGLAAPTPDLINRTVGPTADRLRARTRTAGAEILEKGKRVVKAATTAVKEEAEAQGLTPDFLRQKSTAVAERAKEAIKESAQQEGLTSEGGSPSGHSQPSGSSGQNPLI